MVNVTNGFWQENYGMMIFLFIAVIYVVSRNVLATELGGNEL